MNQKIIINQNHSRENLLQFYQTNRYFKQSFKKVKKKHK